MAGLFGFTAPAATDFTGAAEATAAGNAIANNAATAANRPTQNTPWGSSSWSKDANGNWTQNFSLNPSLQGGLNNQFNTQQNMTGLGSQLSSQLGSVYGQPLNTSGFTGLYGVGNPTGSSANAGWSATPQIQQAMLAQMQPQMDQQRNSEIARLKAQGITEGSEAWNNSMDTLGRQQNNLNLQALQAGNQAANQQFQNQLALDQSNWNQKLQAGSMTGQQRQQQLQEALALRQLPMQEVQQLYGNQIQMPDMPGFSQAGATSGPNYLGASELTTRQNQNIANAKNANSANNWAGAMDLANLGWNIYSNW